MIRVIFIIISFLLTIDARAETRIKDVVTIEGVRENQLIGYGLVVGLNGTGDNPKNALFTQKGILDLLERMGTNIHGTELKTKNVAAVTVTANLPAFARQGSKIGVRVSALGDAKSLRGGTLLATPLLGADGSVYALAQGHVVIPEFYPVTAEVKTKTQSVETSGYIHSGAIIENETEFRLDNLDNLKFVLNYPDFSTSLAIANAINNSVPGNTATAQDSGTVNVIIPNYRKKDVVEFIAQIETLSVTTDYIAKIVINEATGTVVVGDNVRVKPVAIAQGNIVVNIGDKAYERTMPFNAEEDQDTYFKGLNRLRGQGVAQIESGAALSDVVSGLNKLGVWPRDVINILNSMKSVGAIDAIIEVN